MTDQLRAAAQAVVDRWDTPLWKDAQHTGKYIDALRAALAEPVQEPVAWMFVDDTGMRFVSVERPHKDFQPLYATPAVCGQHPRKGAA